MTPLFENHWQALKVRVVLWASLPACAGAWYGAWSIFQSFGLSPADGGALRPFAERLALGSFVAALGIAFLAGMMVFASRYVVRLGRVGDRVVIETLTPWGIGARRHDFALSQLGESAYYHGRMHTPRGHSVNAPWITLRVAGQWLPFLLDLQAEVIEEDELAKIVQGAVAEWQSDWG